jgi:PAS domain S-box-containing protein
VSEEESRSVQDRPPDAGHGSLNTANDDLESLLASTQIAAVFLDHARRVRRVTSTAGEIFDLSPGATGRYLAEVAHHARSMPPLPTDEELLGASKPIEHEVRMLNGRTYLRRVTASRGGQVESAGSVVTFIDITERRQIEDRLRASESLYRAVGESIDYGVWVCEPDGRNVYASDSFLKLIGITQEQCSGFGWGDALHPDDAERTIAAWKRCVETGGPWDIEHRFRDTEGNWHPILARGVAVRGDDGEIICWAGINLDISRRKRAEDELRASEELFRLVADAAPVLIWMSGIDKRYTWLNKRWVDFTGRSTDEELGFGWADSVHPEDRARCLEIYHSSFERRERFSCEYRLKRRDGEYRWMLDHGEPLHDANGGFKGYIGSCIDNHDYKRAEQSLLEADRRKDEFLAMLAHELRNPLAAIVNANTVATRTESDERSRQWAHKVIERQAGQLARLVDDLLDMSRISTGKIRLEKRRVDVVSVLHRALESMQRGFAQKNQSVEAEIADRALPADADSDRLEQILLNVLSNANKYTDAGGRVSVRAAEEAGHAVIRVQDDGVGMGEELLLRIFDPFAQADASLDRAQGGLGLGLTLAKHLIEEHGGYIRARSDGPGKGSEFVIGIPLCSEAPADVGRVGAIVSSGQPAQHRILLVEDNADTAQGLSLLLRQAGHIVRTVTSGDTAVAAATEFSPEVVLLDLGLPGTDGYSIARALRASGGAAGCRIIAISGYGQERDRLRSFEAGIDQHLVKPVEPMRLLELLEASQ